MKTTPQSDRVHIGIFGKCNSGKSSLVNAITGQYTAIVSEVAGTTTDLVTKSMEIAGLGPCVLIDTAGFDDTGRLSAERMAQTRRAMDRVDMAIVVCGDDDDREEIRWIEMFLIRNIPVVAVLNNNGRITNLDILADAIMRRTGIRTHVVNAKTGRGTEGLVRMLVEMHQDISYTSSITGNLAKAGDVVMLVMPQDIQAPKGRLILPQAQTIRELLDKHCVIVGCSTEQVATTLEALSVPPKLVITDSQHFKTVQEMIPSESSLTSFSILFAYYKGDIRSFIEGVEAINHLTEKSKVLIAEACTHAPMNEDIGRDKIPRMLRSRIGRGLEIDIVSGPDFPDDLSQYDLIIHCGGCMFNRRHILSRISKALKQNVPITNYGVTIAFLNDILDKVVYPNSN